MQPADRPARMPPLSPDLFTDETQDFFGRWTGGFFKDVASHPPLATFAHHPHLAGLYSDFNVHLLTTSTLSPKERQIAIMRTVWLCKSTYAWSSHLHTSQLLGLDTAMFRPIQRGADDPYFSEFERTILRATDDIVRDHEVSQDNWDKLIVEWDNKQMLDFLFTVGNYVMSSAVLRSTGVERQEHLRVLAAEYGEPNQTS